MLRDMRKLARKDGREAIAALLLGTNGRMA
jgi:hypothetical protein